MNLYLHRTSPRRPILGHLRAAAVGVCTPKIVFRTADFRDAGPDRDSGFGDRAGIFGGARVVIKLKGDIVRDPVTRGFVDLAARNISLCVEFTNDPASYHRA